MGNSAETVFTSFIVMPSRRYAAETQRTRAGGVARELQSSTRFLAVRSIAIRLQFACSNVCHHQNHLPRRHGCLLRLGGRALRSFAEREGSSSRRPAPRARSSFGCILRGAQIWRAFRHAPANRSQALPACDFRGRPSRPLSRVFRKSLQSSQLLFPASRNGLN